MGYAYKIVASPVGDLKLVASEKGLVAVLWPNDNPAHVKLLAPTENTEHPMLVEVARQLNEYFAGRRHDFDLPLNPLGSERARRLWRLLAEIPYGQTTTYGTLARKLGDGISPRAIGGFVGHNPLSILVPCHRVVGSTGKLTGYAGGLERKRYLLELEKAIPVAPQSLW